MATKLTLTVDSHIIDKAKRYAKAHNISLSQLVEHYFNLLTKNTLTQQKLPPITKSLLGSITADNNLSDKEILKDRLADKYL